jgi:hypothetical protein
MDACNCKFGYIMRSLLATTTLLVGSSLVFSLAVEENWSFAEAFDFCCVTLTTVGYGNLRPSNNKSRAFTVSFCRV